MSFPPQQPGPHGPPQGYQSQQGCPQQQGPYGPPAGRPAQPVHQQPWPGYPPQGQFGGQAPHQNPGMPPPAGKSTTVKIVTTVGAVVLALLVAGGVRAVMDATSGPRSTSADAGSTGPGSTDLGSEAGSDPETGSGPTEPAGPGLSRLGEGDCVNLISPRRAAPIFVQAPCGSGDSDHVVATSMAGSVPRCPGDAYVQLTMPDGSGYCLMMDVEAGDCVDLGKASDVETKVSCGDSSAGVKITTAGPSAAGESVCRPDSDRYVRYPDPGRTVCWKTLSGV